MILTFLELHTKQLGRLLKKLGWVRSLIVLALLAFALARTYTLEPPLTYAIAALLVFSLVSLHVSRKDRAFLTDGISCSICPWIGTRSSTLPA